MSSSKTIVISAGAVAVAVIATIIVFTLSYANTPSQQQDQAITAAKQREVKFLANNLETRINNLISVMNLTSMQQEVRSTAFQSSISTAQMGIPQNADTAKRQVAKNILAQYHDIASIFFLTPKGDLYMGEPYQQQAQLPKLNYADRDWYKGVASTNAPYVSSVFTSAAIHQPAIAVAVPVYAPDRPAGSPSDISGYWVAIVSLANLRDSLASLNQGKSQIIIVDHNGTGIEIETGDTASSSSAQNFSTLESVKAAFAGKSGWQTETVNGTNMNIYYAPASARPHTWAVLSAEAA